MLIYVEAFADNKSDERVGNVCLSVLVQTLPNNFRPKSKNIFVPKITR